MDELFDIYSAALPVVTAWRRASFAHAGRGAGGV